MLLERNAEGAKDLLCDLAVAEVRVAPFHLDHRVDQLSRRALGSWAPTWPGAEEQTIFSLHQDLLKTQEGRSLQDHSYPAQASGRHQECAESENHPIPWGQVRTPKPRTVHDEQQVFDGQRFSRHRTNPARTGEPRESDQQVGD